MFHRLRASQSALVIAAAALVAGCGDDALVDVPKADTPAEAPTLPQLAEGWNEFNPGGDTICSRGTDYAYWVRKGTVNRVVIDFIGGGACWNAFTCSVADAIFQPDVEQVREAVKVGIAAGAYDVSNEENPFRDWYHVVVPYCTGDIHWGDSVTTYSEGTPEEVTIHHKGAVNSRKVLDWVYDEFSAPEHIVVTGCSAGSYGSALWAPHVMEHYPTARVTQFGDSGAGIITQTFFEQSFPSWHAEKAFPTWIPALDPATVDIQKMQLADLYSAVGNHYPEHRISQYNTSFDENQTFYYTAMGGKDEFEWSEKMHASIEKIESSTPNFGAFIAPGEQHCILLFENFYTVNADGLRLVDWLNEILDRAPVRSAKCTDCSGATP